MNTRRTFIKQAGLASTALSTFANPLLGQETARPAPPKKTVRVGFVGVEDDSADQAHGRVSTNHRIIDW